jgi:hypothetical protein
VAAAKGNPNFRPYGTANATLKGLSALEQAELGPHERLQCAWPLIVRLCTAHATRMLKQGIVMVPDDLIQEVAVQLMMKDHKWDPNRGKYTTFVNIVWRNVKQRQRETVGVVIAPHNAYSRMTKLRRQQEAKDFTPGKASLLFSLETVHRSETPLQENQ